jgi:hypothetical protein
MISFGIGRQANTDILAERSDAVFKNRAAYCVKSFSDWNG